LSLDDASDGDWEKVLLKNNRIYQHRMMYVNYTTYDVRRGDDVINPSNSRCNIMGLNADTLVESDSRTGPSRHPYWYARVLGIFHANVIYIGQNNRDYLLRRLEFLWVRWYKVIKVGSWKPQQLDQVSFPSLSDDHAFGFVDPADILRGCHLIPNFEMGKVFSEGDSGYSDCAQDLHDWKSYYVNR
jgi:hypothetical protein